MLEHEIEKIIREFDFDDYSDARACTTDAEWPPILAHKIAVHVGNRIQKVIQAAQEMSL